MQLSQNDDDEKISYQVRSQSGHDLVLTSMGMSAAAFVSGLIASLIEVCCPLPVDDNVNGVEVGVELEGKVSAAATERLEGEECAGMFSAFGRS